MSTTIRKLLLIFVVGVLASCGETGPNGREDDPSSSSPMLWLAENPRSGPWASFAMDAMDQHGPDLLNSTPADIGEWCPDYRNQSEDERKAFWTYLMSSLMRYESDYDPSVTFTEPFDDAAGNRVISRGLLQLSIESANGYGCGIVDANELHDPETNLSCSARIMNRWIERDNVIQSRTLTGRWRGLARYWSPFRRSEARDAMQAQVSRSSYCR